MSLLKSKKVKAVLKRIVEIRKNQIPALQREVNGLVNSIDVGTYRVMSLPGLVIRIRNHKSGGTTQWKSVVEDLAAAYNIPEEAVRRAARAHRTFTNRQSTTRRVAISNDTAKNPRGTKV